MEPLNISREEFPMNTMSVEGMIPMKPIMDNYEIYYKEDVEYLKRGDRTLKLRIFFICRFSANYLYRNRKISYNVSVYCCLILDNYSNFALGDRYIRIFSYFANYSAKLK